METPPESSLVSLDPTDSLWERFYTVNSLVVIGTREGDRYDLAPKHMAMPFGWGHYFGFICTPRHGTYQNAKHNGAFTVTYPRPDQIVLISLSATQRSDHAGHKPEVEALPTFPAEIVDGVFLEDGYLFLECEVHEIVDNLDQNSLIIGEVVAAYAREDALKVSDESASEHVKHAPLLAYIHPGRYTVIEETYEFPLPANFEK